MKYIISKLTRAEHYNIGHFENLEIALQVAKDYGIHQFSHRHAGCSGWRSENIDGVQYHLSTPPLGDSQMREVSMYLNTTAS